MDAIRKMNGRGNVLRPTFDAKTKEVIDVHPHESVAKQLLLLNAEC